MTAFAAAPAADSPQMSPIKPRHSINDTVALCEGVSAGLTSSIGMDEKENVVNEAVDSSSPVGTFACAKSGNGNNDSRLEDNTSSNENNNSTPSSEESKEKSRATDVAPAAANSKDGGQRSSEETNDGLIESTAVLESKQKEKDDDVMDEDLSSPEENAGNNTTNDKNKSSPAAATTPGGAEKERDTDAEVDSSPSPMEEDDIAVAPTDDDATKAGLGKEGSDGNNVMDLSESKSKGKEKDDDDAMDEETPHRDNADKSDNNSVSAEGTTETKVTPVAKVEENEKNDNVNPPPADDQKATASSKDENASGQDTDDSDTNDDDDDDPHDIVERFVKPHKRCFARAMSEIEEGEKRSCWLWFILPTAPYIVDGEERGSYMNRKFALRGDEAVKAFLTYNDGVVDLRHNYMAIVSGIRTHLLQGDNLTSILGPLDDVKAISSFELFQKIAIKMKDKELFTLCKSVLMLCRRPKREYNRGWSSPKKPRRKTQYYYY